MNWVLIWVLFTQNYIFRSYATLINNIKLFHLDFSKSIANIPAFLVVRYIIFFFFLLLMVPQKGPEGWQDKYNLSSMSKYDKIALWFSIGVEELSPQCCILQSRRGQLSHWILTPYHQVAKRNRKFMFERDTIKQMGINFRYLLNKVIC